MSRAPGKFKLADVAKACKGVVRAGLEVQRVEIDDAGKISVLTGKPPANTAGGADKGEWD